MPEPVTLTYLFTAEFTDGSTLDQSPADTSVLEPETRSAYYDVMQSGKTVKRFSLTGNGHTVTVDLSDGHFEVAGVPVWLESDKLPCLPDTFDLIFYRQHTHAFNRASREELNHAIEYFIGWKAQVNGKNYQVVLGVT